MELTRTDTARSHTVTAGEDVVVRLPEAPTTGFEWHADADGLTVTDDRFEPPAGPVGGAGERVWRFRADRVGPATIRLTQRRPWETAAHDEVRYDLEIAPA